MELRHIYKLSDIINESILENKIPKEITFIIQGLVVVFISLKAGITIFLAWKERRKVEKAEKLEKAALAGGAK